MKRLVLLGAGAAHLQVLQALAQAPMAAAEVALIHPFAQVVPPLLLPRLVAGRATAADCSIALAPLATAAGVRLVEATALAIDSAARTVALADGRIAEYDVLSIDNGTTIDRDRLPGARAHAVFTRPVEALPRLLDGMLELAARRVLDIVVVGGGVDAVELVLALWQRLASQEERARLALVTGGPALLAGQPPALAARAAQAMARRRITVVREACVAIDAHAVHLANGARLACDAPVVAGDGEAPALLRSSGLQLDTRGFVLTGPTLQSVSHAAVFAAAEPAAHAGPALALNLRRCIGGGELQPCAPPRAAPGWVDCGDGSAIAAWRGWSLQGRWVGAWKARRDRGALAAHTLSRSGGT